MLSITKTPTAQLHNIVKAFVLGARRSQTALATSAAEPEHQFGSGFAKPRFTPATWLSLTEHSTRLRRCCEVIARNAVGLGATSVPHVDADAATGRRNITNQVKRDVAALGSLLRNPNAQLEPFTEIMAKVEFDFQASGNGYLEVVEAQRDAAENPVGVLHMPGAQVRAHISRDKYVRIYQQTRKRIFFRRFGDTDPAHRFIHKDSGEFFTEWPAGVPEDKRGTALIHVKNYSPLDDYYGVPPSAPAVHAIVGNKLVGSWNTNFLQNNAHIPLAVVVENGNLSPDSTEQIELFLSRDAKGLQNAGRLMVLQPDLSQMLPGSTTKIRLESLQMGVQDDASFLRYRESNSSEIMEAYGLTGILLGLGGSATRATAIAEKQVALEQVILPRTQFWEYIINATIAPAMGKGGAQIHFRRSTNLDALQKASVIQKLRMALSVDDIRKHAAVLLQDVDLAALGTETTSAPLAILDKGSFSDARLDEVLSRLEAAIPSGDLTVAA